MEKWLEITKHPLKNGWKWSSRGIYTSISPTRFSPRNLQVQFLAFWIHLELTFSQQRKKKPFSNGCFDQRTFVHLSSRKRSHFPPLEKEDHRKCRLGWDISVPRTVMILKKSSKLHLPKSHSSEHPICQNKHHFLKDHPS